MIALLIIFIVVLLTMAYSYLKCTALTSFSTLIAAIFGSVVALGYYDALARFILDKGYGGQAALPLSLILLFVLTFAIVRSAADFALTTNIELGDIAKRIAAVICGSVTGLIISGLILIALALAPLGPRWPYARFPDTGVSASTLRSPKKPVINADGFTAGLFSWISRGSLSSSKSFAVYHDDFINQIHLNTLQSKNKVYSIAGSKAASVPARGVRKLANDNENLTVVRIELSNSPVKRGGAKDPDGAVSFSPAQLRLICKPPGHTDTRGAGSAVYPVGRVLAARSIDRDTEKTELTGPFTGKALVRQDLSTPVILAVADFASGKALLDVAFDVPSGSVPVLLEFKQNAVVKLPAPVEASDENEEFLRTGGQQDAPADAAAGNATNP
jgi:hypothetical protein